jgi:hypothetical protein
LIFKKPFVSAYLNESVLIWMGLLLLDTFVPNNQIGGNLIDAFGNTLLATDHFLFDALHVPSMSALSRHLFHGVM